MPSTCTWASAHKYASLLIALVVASPALCSADPALYRAGIEPHWFDRHTRFWYRVETGKSAYEFVLVNPERGTRTAAFDHARLAADLSKRSGTTVIATRLPIHALDFESEAGAVSFSAFGKHWRLDLTRHELRESATSLTLTPGTTPHPSRESGAETSVTFENRMKAPIDIDWLDSTGAPRHYATLPPGGRREQHTYAGHAWLVTGPDHRTLGVFDAADEPATAVVKPDAHATPDTQPATQPAAPPRRKHRPEVSSGVNSPDGKWAAFVKDHNLYVREKRTQKEFALSKDGRPGDEYSEGSLWWSGDSQNLAALRVTAGEAHKIYTVESSPKDQVQPKLRTLDYRKPGDRIEHPHPSLFHLKGCEQVPLKDDLFANPWSIEDVRWAADSSRFTFVYNQRGHQALRVVSVDARTGAARAVVDEVSKTFIDYSGKFFCEWLGDQELIWMSERDGWNHLWLYDAKTGQVKNLITEGNWPVRNVMHVDEERRQVWFMAGGVRPGQDPYDAHFCRVNFDGTGFVVLTEGDGNHAVKWAPGDAYFIDTWSRVDQPPVAELRRSDTGALACKLEEADAGEVLASRGGRWPERFAAKGRDGATDIYGVLFFPLDFDPARKYPVVEEVYAGPQGFYTPKSFRVDYGNKQEIADRGFIVVQCDGMGTSGRSKAFHDVCWKNLKDAGFPDRIAWIKAAAASHPQMDLTRVGIYGGSAGGQNALAALLWHNDFYKVAVADCGCHDNRMDKIWWNEQWLGWPVDSSYEESSNVTHAAQFQGKLMLIVGELDDNVDPSSTIQVVNALEKANKDFELVVVTGAHHGAAETPYGSRRRMEFLTRNLSGPNPSPRNEPKTSEECDAGPRRERGCAPGAAAIDQSAYGQ